MADESTAIALVHAFIVQHPELYCSWVRPHRSMRYDPREGAMNVTYVGGHWRRQALWARTEKALSCVCKFERLGVRPITNLDVRGMLRIL